MQNVNRVKWQQDLTGFEIYDGLTLRPKKNFKLSM